MTASNAQPDSLATIAARLQGYDPQAVSIDAANAFLQQLAQPITGVETVTLLQALGRVLACDVVAPFNVPPHDNAAMDGYAFDGAQLLAAPSDGLRLAVAGTALAGDAGHGALPTEHVATPAGHCVKITTGAVMPAGLDTVVPQEFVQRSANLITIPAGTVQPGDNRRHAGEDLRQGQVALQKGELLQPAALGLLASLGIEHVKVMHRLRVAFFSTGSELVNLGEVSAGQPLPPGKIFDSNRYVLFGLLKRLGCELIDLGVVPDDLERLEAAFVHASNQADVIITSGGVSVGEADHTKAIMNKLGDVAFWRIAMRPGRPMAVGRLKRLPTDHSHNLQAKSAIRPYEYCSSSYENRSESRFDALLFGLPGNPVAVVVTFLALVRPALLRLMGCTAASPPLLKAHTKTPIRKKPGRTEYQRGRVFLSTTGVLQVEIAPNQGSGVLSSLVRGNGLVVLHHAQGNVAAGELVDVMVFDGVV